MACDPAGKTLQCPQTSFVENSSYQHKILCGVEPRIDYNDQGEIWVASSCESGNIRLSHLAADGTHRWSESYAPDGKASVMDLHLDPASRIAVTFGVQAAVASQIYLKTVVFDSRGYHVTDY